MDSLIAHFDLIFVSPKGDERTVRVGVGQPQAVGPGEWVCPTLTQDFKAPKPIHGGDAIQALCLGLAFIRLRLEAHIALGYRLLDPEDRVEIDRDNLAAIFVGMGIGSDTLDAARTTLSQIQATGSDRSTG